MKFEDLRQSYGRGSLEESGVSADPLAVFRLWFEDAERCETITEPNAMCLATADRTGEVTARTVLLKGLDEQGFRFYTNYASLKGTQIAENPRVTLLFYWGPLERQVRIKGVAESLPREESEAYFRARPRGHQIGAWVSPQSEVIPDREYLEQRQREAEARFEGREIPLPANWGGYRVRPAEIEFWQGRPNRLHDRIRFRLADSGWKTERLAP